MEYLFDSIKEFFGGKVVQAQDGMLLNDRPFEIKQMSDGLATGWYTDTGEDFCAMNRFGHIEIRNSFGTCDSAMGHYERSVFDRETAIQEFIAAHEPGKQYSVLDYWHWYRRLSCACYPGRLAFFNSKSLDFDRAETPEWFLNLIFYHAPEPFNDCGGIFRTLLAAYGMEVSE